MNRQTRIVIRETVREAMEYWPNGHLGDYTRREDMRSAFKMIRAHAERSNDVWQAIGALQRDVDRYFDM